MNTMEQELENVLRAAPRPAPPAGLKDRLLAQARLAAVRPAPQASARPAAPASWLSRWWPVLVPAAASVACAAGLAVQQIEIRHLRRTIQDLSRETAPKPSLLPPPAVQTHTAVPHADAAAATQQEITRLKGLASQLAAEVAQLEQLRADNAQLRTKVATPPAGLFTPEEAEALTRVRERAESNECFNKLRLVALAMRTWALDNGGASPPDILSMSKELGSPKILVCPGDRAHQAAKDWASYTPDHCSYEYLVPSVLRIETETNRVAFRCPIHGNVCLCDGSMRVVAKDDPERLVQRGGKLYFIDLPTPDKAPRAPQSANPPPGGSNP